MHWYLANKVTDTHKIDRRRDQTEITNRRLFLGAQCRTTWPVRFWSKNVRSWNVGLHGHPGSILQIRLQNTIIIMKLYINNDRKTGSNGGIVV